MSWLEFGRTLLDNAWYGSRIGPISDKYPLDISPAPATFGIWGVIYYGIFITLLLTEHMDDNTCAPLFAESMRLNRQWIRVFTSDDPAEAYDVIRKLRDVNVKLVAALRAKGVNNYYVEMYSTWVSVATVLSERIASYGDGKDPVEALNVAIRDMFAGKEISYAESVTLRWAIQGISPTKNLELFDMLKKSLSDGRVVTLAELIGIDRRNAGTATPKGTLSPYDPQA
jgi:tryptophan-rich sensory protein